MDDPDSPRAAEARLLALLHTSTPAELSALVRRADGHPRASRAASSPAIAFSSMATPKVVQRAMKSMGMQDMAAAAALSRSRMPIGMQRRPPIPQEDRGPRRRGTAIVPPPPGRERSAPRVRPPPPLERMYLRGVASKLEQIQGDRKRRPLREALGEMPAFLALDPRRQRELSELVLADHPAVFNTGGTPGLAGQNIRDVLAALKLREDSSLRVEMQVYDRQLEMEQMRARMRGVAAAAPQVERFRDQ